MKEEKNYNKNHLIWIGIGVFICLTCLTIISLLDLRRDFQKNPLVNNQATMAAFGQAYFSGARSTVGCPYCRIIGIPQCFYCGSSMLPNSSTGIYCCPRCQRIGSALCPGCGIPMRPLRNLRATPIDPRGNLYPQGNNILPVAGCATCPSRSYCQPAASQGQQVAMPCPGACPGCPLGTPQIPNQQVAWPNSNAPFSQVGGFGRPNYLICPNCNYTMPHQFGVPAYTVTCPKCGTRMIRGQ